jgi:hypothetical protein
MWSGIIMMKQYSSCHFAWKFFCELHPEASNITSQYNAELIFSPRFWKLVNSIPWESESTVSITFLAYGVTLNFWLKVIWDVSIALKHALILVCSDSPMIRPPLVIMLSISPPSSAYRKRCYKDRPIPLIFSRSFSFLGTYLSHTFRNFKLEWTLPPAAQLLL